MKVILTSFLILINIVTFASKSLVQSSISEGSWLFKMDISKDCYLPIKGVIKKGVLTIENGSEKINLEPFRNENNTLKANFSLYHSSIFITESSKNKLSGYWRNYSKKGNYRINFTASRKPSRIKCNRKTLQILDGKWEATIQFRKPTKLVGDFIQANKSLRGTFRSETGDYRFLAGHTIKDSLFLSCFDGTHCYLFTGRLHGQDSISGHFYSGSHYKTTWTAKKNPNVTLRSPDSLTYLANQKEIHFSLLNTNNDTISYASIRDNAKPTIIQIFGSWCPNCVDETNYLNAIDKEYGDNINIVGIGFEMGKDDVSKMEHLQKFKISMGIKYPLLLGGAADKKEASQLFPMLNNVMSFPTLLVINQDGKVVKIHTGFNGPATGPHYDQFKKEMSDLLKNLTSI